MTTSTKPLLRQNAELRKDRVWNWTLPAFVTTLPDGRNINVCPQAGACAKLCYATNGTYRFPAVKAAHQRNLLLTLDEPRDFLNRMRAELMHKRFQLTGVPRLPDLPRDHLHPRVAQLLDAGCAAVRIHDSGDFYSDEYLHSWVALAIENPGILFYAYSKEVSRFRRLQARCTMIPPNFLWVYSLGGKEDHLLDLETDRHAEVFPDEAAIEAAGYYSQDANDLLCVLAPSNKIGIPANGIPAFKKKQGEKTFGQIEAEKTRHSRST